MVVELGVEHDGGARPQAGQRAVGLVGLRHDEPAARRRARSRRAGAPSPPIRNVGSSPHSASTYAISALVLVLPCAPATQMPSAEATMSASTSARWRTRRPRLRAAASSGSSSATALETITSMSAVQVRGIVADLRVDALGAQLLDRRRGSDRSPRPCGRGPAARARCPTCRRRRRPSGAPRRSRAAPREAQELARDGRGGVGPRTAEHAAAHVLRAGPACRAARRRASSGARRRAPRRSTITAPPAPAKCSAFAR